MTALLVQDWTEPVVGKPVHVACRSVVREAVRLRKAGVAGMGFEVETSKAEVLDRVVRELARWSYRRWPDWEADAEDRKWRRAAEAHCELGQLPLPRRYSPTQQIR